MNQTRIYSINGKRINENDSLMQQYLSRAYESKLRPVCHCKAPYPAMYIAKINGQYVMKRMPDSGEQHSVNCESFKYPIGLSGLGQVTGSAIIENVDDGTTSLKFDFSLSKRKYYTLTFYKQPQYFDAEGRLLDKKNRKKLRIVNNEIFWRINDRVCYTISNHFR